MQCQLLPLQSQGWYALLIEGGKAGQHMQRFLGLGDERLVGVDLIVNEGIVDMVYLHAHLLQVDAKDGVLVAVLVAVLGEGRGKEDAALDEQIDGAEILVGMLATVVKGTLPLSSKLIAIAQLIVSTQGLLQHHHMA